MERRGNDVTRHHEVGRISLAHGKVRNSNLGYPGDARAGLSLFPLLGLPSDFDGRR